MFCTKCGSKNPDNSNFCEKCGAKMPVKKQTPAQPTIQSNPQSNYYSAPAPKIPVNTYYPKPTTPIQNVMNAEIKKKYWITLFLHVISIILFFVPSLFSRASIDGSLAREEIESMFTLFTNSSFVVAFIITVVKITSAVLTALPLFYTNRKITLVLIVSKIITALELLWLFLCIIMMVSEASTQTQRYSDLGIESSAGLTIGGYLYLASLLALFVMLFVTTAKSKNITINNSYEI